MNFIFGPVNSRRLGISLGIDLLPAKICNFNCIYCEIGPTTSFTAQRGEYTPTAEVIAEIDAFCADPAALARLDVLTITASGEPTLHSGLGEIIAHIKKKIAKPVAVLSNGSLFHLAEVRRELAAADIVIPSLDSALEESFRRINRPTKECRLPTLIDGISRFCREFKGRCWLEILLAKGINDQPADLAALAEAVARIQPERVQLNTVARPPLESFALPLSPGEMRAAAAYFTIPVDILTNSAAAPPTATDPLTSKRGGTADAAPPELSGVLQVAVSGTVKRASAHEPDRSPQDAIPRDHLRGQRRDEEEVLHLLQRRPCTAADLATALGLPPERVAAALDALRAAGRIGPSPHLGKEYFIILAQG